MLKLAYDYDIILINQTSAWYKRFKEDREDSQISRFFTKAITQHFSAPVKEFPTKFHVTELDRHPHSLYSATNDSLKQTLNTILKGFQTRTS
jgi:hypothetical protein